MRCAGESHPRAKLSDSQVEAIHAAHANGASVRALASRYQVSHGAIGDILTGRRRGLAGMQLTSKHAVCGTEQPLHFDFSALNTCWGRRE